MNVQKERQRIDRIVYGIIIGSVGTLAILVGGIFMYGNFVANIFDDDSRYNDNVLQTQVDLQSAVDIAQSINSGSIQEVSLESEHGELLREIEFDDEQYVIVDAHDGSVFVENEEDDHYDEDDAEDDIDLFEELLGELHYDEEDDHYYEDDEEEHPYHDEEEGEEFDETIDDVLGDLWEDEEHEEDEDHDERDWESEEDYDDYEDEFDEEFEEFEDDDEADPDMILEEFEREFFES